jgi:hypothetical protein
VFGIASFERVVSVSSKKTSGSLLVACVIDCKAISLDLKM